MPTIDVRAFKVTIALDAALLPTDCIAPDGQPAPTGVQVAGLNYLVPGRSFISATISVTCAAETPNIHLMISALDSAILTSNPLI